ncbi:MAG: hypothetical protein RL133_1586 [Pseudomonadota bacterium]|jgi:hypothetical protein
MNERPFSAGEVIALLSQATQNLLEAQDPQSVMERLGSALVEAYLAESFEISAPFGGLQRGGPSGAPWPIGTTISHDLREGVWMRQVRINGPQRQGPQATQIAHGLLSTAQQRMETILQLATLSSDLSHAHQTIPQEDLETSLRKGLVRSLEWALERSVVHGSAVAVFQIEWLSDLTEQERLEVTALLRASLRKGDQVVRLNSERVVVLLEGLVAPDSVLRVEERLTQRMRGQSMEFWAGVALSPAHAKTPERLLGLSERALQEARALGLRGFFHYGAASDLAGLGAAQ